MVQRGASARFMAGAWVFPGGVVDPGDDRPEVRAVLEGVTGDDTAFIAAGVRELVEEAGFWLGSQPRVLPVADRPHGDAVFAAAASDPFDVSAVALYSNWVTPSMVPVRFDARFYVAEVPNGLDGAPDLTEVDDARWVRPQVALEAAAAGDFLVAFPTRVTLEEFAALGDPSAIVRHAQNLTEVVPVQPRLRVRPGGTMEVLVPGDDGFDDLEDLPPDPSVLAGVVRVTTAGGAPVPEMTPSPTRTAGTASRERTDGD